MRSLAVLGLVVMVACGGEDRPISTAEPPAPQQLEIPPMDAGAPLVIEAPPDAGAPPPAPELDPRATTTLTPMDDVTARDPRAISSSIRAPALVATEVQGLEQLLGTVPPTDPRYVHILRRTAEACEELAHVSKNATVTTASRRKEVGHYTTIANSYPSYAALDEVRYYRGLAYERLGDLKNARSSYYELIKSHPQSKLIPHAYFAFGELFFQESQSDPSKWDLAKQAFLEVIKSPAAHNSTFPFALLRLGQVADAQGDTSRAKAHYDRLRRELPSSPAVKQIPTGR